MPKNRQGRLLFLIIMKKPDQYTKIIEWYPYADKTPIRNLHKSALDGKRVFLRVNYDVVRDARIIDDRRIRATVMDIRHILKQGARTVVIVSHNGVKRELLQRSEDLCRD